MNFNRYPTVQNRLGSKKKLFFPGKASPRNSRPRIQSRPHVQNRQFSIVRPIIRRPVSWRPFRHSPILQRTFARRFCQSGQQNAPKFAEYVQQQRVQFSNVMRLAMYSFGTTVLFLTLPILLWPLVDMVLFPQGLRDAIQRKRIYPNLYGDAHEAVMKLQRVAKTENGKIIVLSGPHANELANHYLQETDNSLPLDFRRLLWCHPYDWILFDHLPEVHWQFLNAYTSLIIFASHNISKTSPHTDALMFFAYAFNKLEEALNKLDFQKKPSVIWKNVDSPFLHGGGYNGDSENLKTYGQQCFQNMVISTGCEHRSATTICTTTQNDFDIKEHYPEFTDGRCAFFNVDVDVDKNFVLKQVSGEPVACLQQKGWFW